MKKYLSVALVAFGAIGCGDVAVANNPMTPCDVQSVDASTSQDAPTLETSVDSATVMLADASQTADVAPRAPYNLTLRIYPGSDHQGVQFVQVRRLMPMGPNVSYTGSPTRPMFIAGEYEPVVAEIMSVREEAVIINIDWTFQYNAMGDTASTGLFDRDSMGLNYRYRGRVEIRDQYDRTWVGYPTSIDNVTNLYLRFVAGPCASDFTMRRDGLCIR